MKFNEKTLVRGGNPSLNKKEVIKLLLFKKSGRIVKLAIDEPSNSY